MVFRLYLVYKDTGKCTGKKRDYPSEEHFIKYGIETYERYNADYYWKRGDKKVKAKLCYLDGNNKWAEVAEEVLAALLALGKK